MQIWRIARFTLVAALASFMVACGEDAAEPAAPVVVNKSPNDEREYAAVTLDNGLQVLMVSDATTEKSAAALSVGVGAFQIPWTFRGWLTTSSTCCSWARNHSRSLTAT